MSSQRRVGRNAASPLPSAFAFEELNDDEKRTSLRVAIVRGGCGTAAPVADGTGVGKLVGCAPRSSLEMRLMASRAVARDVLALTVTAEARCRLIQPDTSIVVRIPTTMMETSSSTSVSPA